MHTFHRHLAARCRAGPDSVFPPSLLASPAASPLPFASLLSSAASALSPPLSASSAAAPPQLRTFHSSALAHAKAPLPPSRTQVHDAVWDKLRLARRPRITTLPDAAQEPGLMPNDNEINHMHFPYGLPAPPAISQRAKQYAVEQSYYDRRDERIKDHIDRLLRMKKLSKREMLMLIDQLESNYFHLPELQKAYLPEIRHFDQEADLDHRRYLLTGTGGALWRAENLKRREEKKKRRAEEGPRPTKDNPLGLHKYGYRKDLANFGPTDWDYLTPYIVFEAEARHLSYLDGAFKYEDRYILWEQERRNVALAAKLQRMKLLGIPLSQADSLATPDSLPADPMYPPTKVRRRMDRLLARDGRLPAGFFEKYLAQKTKETTQSNHLPKLKESRTLAAAKQAIPDYIARFEKENQLTELNPGSAVVLAQNLYIRSLINQYKDQPSLLSSAQQESCKALLRSFAHRNRLALNKIYLSTRSSWEGLMVERALERKYLQHYSTVGSETHTLAQKLRIEAEMTAVAEDIHRRFSEIDWTVSAIQLRDARRQEKGQEEAYTEDMLGKIQQLMDENNEAFQPSAEYPGGRHWIRDVLKWEDAGGFEPWEKEAKKKELAEKAAEERDIQLWNDWWDVQIAQELSAMIDSGELPNADPANLPPGAVKLAEMRVGKRIYATRDEYREWKYKPTHMKKEDMAAPPSDLSQAHSILQADDAAQRDAASQNEDPLEAATPGKQLIKQILAQDKVHKISTKMNDKMRAKLDSIDDLMEAEIPGRGIHQLNATGKAVEQAATAAGPGPVVGDVEAGAVLPDFDPKATSAGHYLIDESTPYGRRLGFEHARKSKWQEESARSENPLGSEDPFLKLLEGHNMKQQDGEGDKAASDGSGGGGGGGGSVDGEDSSDRYKFNNIDRRLGFADDDFRLYDPVLTKGEEQARKKRGEEYTGAQQVYQTLEEHVAAFRSEQMKLARDPFEPLGDNTEGGLLDPVYWERITDGDRRRQLFLDLDPFGPANTDERRDFDDFYTHLEEEDFAFKKRIDPEGDYPVPLDQETIWTNQPGETLPHLMRFELSDETYELLYLLHRSDPVKYTPRALAHKFRLSADRVKNALVMQSMHYRMVEQGIPHPQMGEFSSEQALSELVHHKLPIIHDPPANLNYQPLADFRWVREDDLHRVKLEEEATERRFLSRSDRLDRAEREYYARFGAIGTDPPPPAPPLLLDERVMAPSRHTAVLVDLSELPAARYSFAVRDRKGLLREPSEEEYFFLKRQEKGKHFFQYIKYQKEDNPM